jgi:hypothetical protein
VTVTLYDLDMLCVKNGFSACILVCALSPFVLFVVGATGPDLAGQTKCNAMQVPGWRGWAAAPAAVHLISLLQAAWHVLFVCILCFFISAGLCCLLPAAAVALTAAWLLLLPGLVLFLGLLCA